MSRNVVLVTGAAGFLGNLLSQALRTDFSSSDVHLILADIVEPRPLVGSKAITLKADLTKKTEVDALFCTEFGIPNTVYCLHGIMSRGSEENFDFGVKVNVDSVRSLLESTRQYGKESPIKFIFTSSLAVYGGPLPEIITPTTIATPESAYGMGKLLSEIMINEYSRRDLSMAGSSDFPLLSFDRALRSHEQLRVTAIIREPLKGERTVCPIGNSIDSPELGLAVWVASPETTIKNFIKAKYIPAEKLFSHTRVICLPGFTTTIKEELEALEQVVGKEAVNLVEFQDDPVNRRVVSSWPAKFDNSYALSLGFIADEGGMVPVVQQFHKNVTRTT
ncbi:hypothetical protein BDQ17DRAFT_1325271 [Cyathus striatus]|nr:hypothetical protein BDQ17DRAFT_1325271 [Cyathus striatus]